MYRKETWEDTGEGAYKKGQRKEIRRREVKQKDVWKSVQKNKRSGGEMLL